MRPLFAVFASLCMLFGAAPLAAQNLVANGDFNQDLLQWEPIGPGSWQAQWVPQDADGNPASGSVLLSNGSSLANFDATILRQCLSTPLRGTYALRATGLLPSGQSRTGFWAVDVTQRYNGAGCSGGSQGGGAAWAPGVIGTWTPSQWSFTFDSVPVNGTLEVTLHVQKVEAGGQLNAYVDAVSLSYDTLLWDGFDPAE